MRETLAWQEARILGSREGRLRAVWLGQMTDCGLFSFGLGLVV